MDSRPRILFPKKMSRGTEPGCGVCVPKPGLRKLARSEKRFSAQKRNVCSMQQFVSPSIHPDIMFSEICRIKQNKKDSKRELSLFIYFSTRLRISPWVARVGIGAAEIMFLFEDVNG